MLQNNFKYWYSKENKIDTQGIISLFEQNENIKLPTVYKEMVRIYDGGTLARNIFTYKNNGSVDENCVGYFLCWQSETLGHYYSYLQNVYNDPPEFFPKKLIPFAPDGGGNYICFDYRICQENPPVVFWHHEVEENEGIFMIANSFDEFLYNLKSREEMK